MIILVDTNVFLDLALKREQHYVSSAAALIESSKARNKTFVAWHSLSNIYYILRRSNGHEPSVDFLTDLLSWVQVAPADHAGALSALRLNLRDFEDALQASGARACSADIILTRNTADFVNSPVPALSPEDFLKLIQ